MRQKGEQVAQVLGALGFAGRINDGGRLLAHVARGVPLLPELVALQPLHDAKGDRKQPGLDARSAFELVQAACRDQKDLVHRVIDPVFLGAQAPGVAPNERVIFAVKRLYIPDGGLGRWVGERGTCHPTWFPRQSGFICQNRQTRSQSPQATPTDASTPS